MSCHYHIRLAQQKDLPWLPEIERQAAIRFVPYGLAETMSTFVTPDEDFREGLIGGCLWVAVDPGDRPVGFALVRVDDNKAHLAELDVLPEHGRRGLGTALVETACQWAKEAGFSIITLNTLSQIPWHVPFYQNLGFYILQPEAYTDLQEILSAFELDLGHPGYQRVMMYREL